MQVLPPLCAELRNLVMQPMILPMVLTIAESQVLISTSLLIKICIFHIYVVIFFNVSFLSMASLVVSFNILNFLPAFSYVVGQK